MLFRSPSQKRQERIRRSLFARVAAGGATILLSAGVAAAPGVKILVSLAVVLTAAAGGGVWLYNHEGKPSHQPPMVHVQARDKTTASTPALPAAEAIEPLAEAKRQRRAPASGPAVTRKLQEETAFLGRINRALLTGAAPEALALLDEYDRRFPGGALREEVQATRIIARCQLHERAALDAARRFFDQHPTSPLSPRVRTSCKLAEPPGR